MVKSRMGSANRCPLFETYFVHDDKPLRFFNFRHVCLYYQAFNKIATNVAVTESQLSCYVEQEVAFKHFLSLLGKRKEYYDRVSI